MKRKQRINPGRAAGASALREDLVGWLFVLPAVVLVFVFGFFPIFFAGYMSLFDWRIRQGASFCGRGLEEGASSIAFLTSCFGQYTIFIGDWGGAALFVLGFILLFVAYRVWTRRFNRFDGSAELWIRAVATLALVALAFALISQGYAQMFAALRPRDRGFLEGLQITFFYAFGSIPVQIALGLVLAYVLHQQLKGKQFFRMIFFLPYVTPTVAAAVVFGQIFSGRDTSLANQFATFIGMDVQRWLSEPRPFLNVVFGLNLEGFLAGPSMALVCVIILGWWTYTGYNAVIFLAGLGNIPRDLYEAARVDGANDWHIFRFITLPLLSPVTFYLTILGFIGTFTAFNTLFVMRTPASQGTLNTSALVIFDTFRSANRWGEAAAMSIVLLLIVLALTQVQRSVFEKRVFYG